MTVVLKQNVALIRSSKHFIQEMINIIADIFNNLTFPVWIKKILQQVLH